MINSKRRSDAVKVAFSSTVLLYLTINVLAPSLSLAADKTPPAQTCSKAWATGDQMKSKNYVYGLGLSAKKSAAEAADEAKQNAYKDVAQQLQSNVKSEAKLSETESGSTYAGQIDLSSNLISLTGINVVKEGADSTSGITKCTVAKFDAGSAYTELEGKMNVLEKNIAAVSSAAKAKKYVEVLQKRGSAKKIIAENLNEIRMADLFRMYLKADDQSWFEKIKGQESDIDRAADEAKANIVFILPSGHYEGTMSDVESKLAGQGFEVIHDPKSAKAVKLTIELKETGTPRKTKTALGVTVISRVAVNLKDGTGRVIATNKGAQLTGTGNTDEDAIANIDRQLLVHVVDTLNQGLPGLIAEE